MYTIDFRLFFVDFVVLHRASNVCIRLFSFLLLHSSVESCQVARLQEFRRLTTIRLRAGHCWKLYSEVYMVDNGSLLDLRLSKPKYLKHPSWKVEYINM